MALASAIRSTASWNCAHSPSAIPVLGRPTTVSWKPLRSPSAPGSASKILASRRPDLRPGTSGQRNHQLVEPLHEAAGVVELSAFGQHRLIEQDVAPIRKALL